MPLKLKCPTCGREGTVPNAALNRTVQCLSCDSTYTVRDAVQDSSGGARAAREGTPRSEKILLGFAFGMPGALLLVFLIYWFGIRDTWEMDNYSQILQRCEAVQRAISESDDNAAAQAYTELNDIIGDRTVKHRTLANRLEQVRAEFSPVQARLEEARLKREAEELAKRQRDDAMAETPTSQPTTRNDFDQYYRNRFAKIAAEAEQRRKLDERGERVQFILFGVIPAVFLFVLFLFWVFVEAPKANARQRGQGSRRGANAKELANAPEVNTTTSARVAHERQDTKANAPKVRARIQYRVSGVHRDSGSECTVNVYAADEEAAIRLTNAQDILVGEIAMVAIEDMGVQTVAEKPSKSERKGSSVRCPHCRSTNVTPTKKGFGLGKAAAGGLLLGPVGLLGGLIGSNKINITCLNCGKVFEPGRK